MFVFRFAWWTLKATLALAAIATGLILLVWMFFAALVFWLVP